MKPHKHAELIKAWADGATAQSLVHGKWQDREYPTWWEELEWRIKPEPEPDVIRYYKCFENPSGVHRIFDIENADLMLIHDGNTGKLKRAKVI